MLSAVTSRVRCVVAVVAAAAQEGDTREQLERRCCCGTCCRTDASSAGGSCEMSVGLGGACSTERRGRGEPGGECHAVV